MMNTYTLEVYNKENKPLFVVTIKSPFLAGVYFFNSMKEANEFVNTKKASLNTYGCTLKYNCEGVTDEFINTIKEVVENDDIAIGANGRTYSKKLFPDGI